MSDLSSLYVDNQIPTCSLLQLFKLLNFFAFTSSHLRLIMASSSDTAGKVWLITGCSSGMGLAFARAALAAGHRVIATSRNPSASAEIATEFTSRGSVWLPLDISAPEATVNAQVDAAIAAFGRIDVLLNNAGQGFSGTVEDSSMEEVRKGFDVNLFGTWAVTKRIVPLMREQKSGTIITNSSIFGFASFPTCAIYSGTKHALTGLMDALTWEMQPFGVRIILLEPGGVR